MPEDPIMKIRTLSFICLLIFVSLTAFAQDEAREPLSEEMYIDGTHRSTASATSLSAAVEL